MHRKVTAVIAVHQTSHAALPIFTLNHPLSLKLSFEGLFSTALLSMHWLVADTGILKCDLFHEITFLMWRIRSL
jgi:hypothetical protein